MNDIVKTIQHYLDLSKDDKKERLDKIGDLIHFLNFEKRLTELTEDESAAMMNSDNGNENDIFQYRLLHCRTDTERDELVADMARRKYFIKCAWSDYLNGVSDFKPYDSKREAERLIELLKKDYEPRIRM